MQIPYASRCSLFFCLVFLLCTVGRNCAQMCQSTNFTSPKFQSNLNIVLNSFVSNRSVSERFNTSVSANSTPYTVYGLFQCWGDTTADECLACAQEANSTIRKSCGNARGGRAWLDKCFIRYETSNFFGTLDLNFDSIRYSTENVTDQPNVFRTAVRELFTNLSDEAVQSPVRYASGSTVTSTFYAINAFVQCWRDLTAGNDCKICLASAIRNLLGVTLTENGTFVGGVGQCGSCIARYEKYSFFNPAPPPPPSPLLPLSFPPPIQLTPVSSPIPEKKSSTKIFLILGIVGGFFFLLMLCLFVIRRKLEQAVVWMLAVMGKDNRRAAEENPNRQVDSAIGLEENITFNLKNIKAATRNFHEENKLGQGGFGVVYKGTMPNGTQIAVKRLSVESTSGRRQFLNEVKLVAKIQHRNLVNLLGCCVDGSERLLVYEFLSNKSLDKILFHPQRNQELDWSKRLNIIVGVGRGLLYLHQDSQLRIIHRDIKASNILLDEKMEPKISDFGVAKLLRVDETHVNTNAEGTLGYMAPEYAFRGQLSIKADIYSFGILILEIICGRKNNDLRLFPEFQNLLEWVWKSYMKGNIIDVIDKTLIQSSSNEHFSKYIQIALLCTQANPSLRPPMVNLHVMLSNPTLANLPNPTIPAYVNNTKSIFASINDVTITDSSPR